MHKYNPLELPEIIANIIRNLSLHDINLLCWINYTWYKEIQQELRKRCKKQMIEYYKIWEKAEKEYEELHKHQPDCITACDLINVGNVLNRKMRLIAKEQILIEGYMLKNGMVFGQEKEIVKYNIKTFLKNRIPWQCENWIDKYKFKYGNSEEADGWDFSISIHQRKCYDIFHGGSDIF